MSDASFGAGFGTALGIIGIGVLCGALYGCPQYNVYQSRMSGQAKLAEAQSEREVQVRDAQAKLDSAKLYAAAEVERAKGVKASNDIVQAGLGGPEGYLRYLWIQKMGQNGQDVIYVPTEAGMPILEAGRGAQRFPHIPAAPAPDSGK